ncbi:hypothetical protein L3Q82_021387 [Xyrichtys novacula]|uniref:Uncharacterized protein n=1 Tax=Xyrichtys novacula TaxID=13765 RepID=A0AAV1GHE8_XYRNO|nr:hypothetical protein L3Q82_021387 [Xyrichtys novacula]
MAVRILIVACLAALFLGTCITVNGLPTEVTHAYCRIVWLLGLPCERVSMAILTQIKAMGSYKLVSVAAALIQANHTSAVGQIENVNITFAGTAMSMGCHVEGTSVSAFWFSLFDNGTNYCNLHNIIEGSGLTKAPGFIEYTNEWLCLGMGSSACK